MRTLTLALSLLIPLTPMSSHTYAVAQSQTRTAPAKARPFHMTGVVKNSQGKPLAGVRVGADNTVLDGSEVWTTTDAQGRYDLDLSRMPILNSWTAVAHVVVKYGGEQQTLTPEVDNSAPFLGKDGAIRNFTLKITGKSPGGGYYGALFYANLGLSEAGEMPEWGDVEFTLTPAGPLIDGSKGQPIKLRQSQLPFEVPQGRYKVTARSISGKGPIWLKVRGGAYGPEAVLHPTYTAGTGMTLSVDMVHPRR
ncbi:carboxypeptidase regulatory-like domain-containing protein [Deinococcus sp. SDU3-2]|uniref:Carboxypeptidase regulatory-like domain-containing protein n=1 Tax=Deinococcus terrestris TaxID=2651870 RepID=A0A7X1NV65_9DEIO|nr:carboxypeptidase regulatory-like domain-containing protein [Deinococcus terrestris]MPY66405.1 carboxypeptidase regulatory-like domain-containing protein [Deinococcus terrestris]